MPIVSRQQRVHLTPLTSALLLISTLTVGLTAQTRKVSIESFVYDLKHPDAVRRQTAVRELGANRYRAAIPQMIPLTTDPVAAVRRELELSFERMDDVGTLPGFIALASDIETDVRGRALASIVNVYVPHAIGLTLANLRERMSLGSPGDLDVIVEPDVIVDATVVETLQSHVGDADRGIRRNAIRGLGILQVKRAVPDLLQVVREDRDNSLRLDGVRALRKIGDASIGSALVALLNINDNDVRDELISTLAALKYRPAVPALTRIVDQSKSTDRSSILAVAALADLGDPSSAPTFERFRADKNEWLRLFANEGIARVADDTKKIDISAARLTEKSPRVRTAQAFALLRLGQSEYLDELIRALDRPATHDLAKEYLLETQPEYREALFAPRTANSSTRAELAEVFGLMGDPNALPRLQELTHESDIEVAQAAERATRRITVGTTQ